MMNYKALPSDKKRNFVLRTLLQMVTRSKFWERVMLTRREDFLFLSSLVVVVVSTAECHH